MSSTPSRTGRSSDTNEHRTGPSPALQRSPDIYSPGHPTIYDPVHDSYDVRNPAQGNFQVQERFGRTEHAHVASMYSPTEPRSRHGGAASTPLPPLRTYTVGDPHARAQGHSHGDPGNPLPFSAQGLDRRIPPFDTSPSEHTISPSASMPPRFPGSFRLAERSTGSVDTSRDLPPLSIPPQAESPSSVQSPLSAEGKAAKRNVMACHQW